MKILMVLTSHDQLGNTGKPTGFWLEEFPFSSGDDAASTCVRRYCAAARSIIDAEHPKSLSDLSRVRRRIAKLLHPGLGSGTEVACRAHAMAMMNRELDELGSQFLA
jgi:hypothetical protein